MNKKDMDIINKFYDNYLRAPVFGEFKKLGGETGRKFYNDLLKEMRMYEPNAKPSKVIEIIDNRGNIIFIGNAKEVAEELDLDTQHVRKSVRQGITTREGYTLRERKVKLDDN